MERREGGGGREREGEEAVKMAYMYLYPQRSVRNDTCSRDSLDQTHTDDVIGFFGDLLHQLQSFLECQQRQAYSIQTGMTHTELTKGRTILWTTSTHAHTYPSTQKERLIFCRNNLHVKGNIQTPFAARRGLCICCNRRVRVH